MSNIEDIKCWAKTMGFPAINLIPNQSLDKLKAGKAGLLFKDLTTRIKPKQEISLIRLSLKVNEIMTLKDKSPEMINYYKCTELKRNINNTIKQCSLLKEQHDDLLKKFNGRFMEREAFESFLRNSENKQVFLKSKIDEIRKHSSELNICFDLALILSLTREQMTNHQKKQITSAVNLLKIEYSNQFLKRDLSSIEYLAIKPYNITKNIFDFNTAKSICEFIYLLCNQTLHSITTFCADFENPSDDHMLYLNNSQSFVNRIKIFLKLRIIELSKGLTTKTSSKDYEKEQFLQSHFEKVISKWKSNRDLYIHRGCEIKKYQESYEMLEVQLKQYNELIQSFKNEFQIDQNILNTNLVEFSNLVIISNNELKQLRRTSKVNEIHDLIHSKLIFNELLYNDSILKLSLPYQRVDSDICNNFSINNFPIEILKDFASLLLNNGKSSIKSEQPDDNYLSVISDQLFSNTLDVLDSNLSEIEQKLNQFENILEMLIKTKFSKFFDHNTTVGEITLADCENKLKSYCDRWKDF